MFGPGNGIESSIRPGSAMASERAAEDTSRSRLRELCEPRCSRPGSVLTNNSEATSKRYYGGCESSTCGGLRSSVRRSSLARPTPTCIRIRLAGQRGRLPRVAPRGDTLIGQSLRSRRSPDARRQGQFLASSSGRQYGLIRQTARSLRGRGGSRTHRPKIIAGFSRIRADRWQAPRDRGRRRTVSVTWLCRGLVARALSESADRDVVMTTRTKRFATARRMISRASTRTSKSEIDDL